MLVAALRLAWLSDDSLITLRTALNITHGWGPGFNATESVQAYTHPLWFLLWVTTGALTNQWVLGIIAVSLVLSTGAVALVAWRTKSLARLIVAIGLLLFSNAFMEYTSSGLENPLGYLTVGVLIPLSLSLQQVRSRWWLRPALIGLTSAAVVLTRFDLLLLALPALALMTWQWRHSLKSIGVVLAGALVPLLAWFIWSQATYGAFLPNTYLAKRNVDIPASELIVQGLRYLWLTFEHDPVSLLAIVVGVGGALAIGTAISRAWAIGIVIYLGYVIWIGGDFMAGRFLAVPVFASVFILACLRSPLLESPSQQQPRHEELTRVLIALVLVVGLAGGSSLAGSTPVALANPTSPRWEVDQNYNFGVSDERGTYIALKRDLKGLIDTLSEGYLNPDIAPLGDGSGLNRTLREINRATQNWPTNDGKLTTPSEVGVYCGFLGTLGIATGPRVHLIDSCGLTDQFLANMRYAPAEPFAWKPGHFERAVPDGYSEAMRTGQVTQMKDPLQALALDELWAQIRPGYVRQIPTVG